MTYSEEHKIEWLKRYRLLGLECERLDDEILRWREVSQRTTRQIKQLPGARGDGAGLIDLAVAEIDALQRDLLTTLRDKAMLRREIEDAVAALGDDRLELVLRLRYIEGCKWREVAERMYYSEMQTMRLHHEALGLLALPAADVCQLGLGA